MAIERWSLGHLKIEIVMNTMVLDLSRYLNYLWCSMHFVISFDRVLHLTDFIDTLSTSLSFDFCLPLLMILVWNSVICVHIHYVCMFFYCSLFLIFLNADMAEPRVDDVAHMHGFNWILLAVNEGGWNQIMCGDHDWWINRKSTSIKANITWEQNLSMYRGWKFPCWSQILPYRSWVESRINMDNSRSCT